MGFKTICRIKCIERFFWLLCFSKEKNRYRLKGIILEALKQVVKWLFRRIYFKLQCNLYPILIFRLATLNSAHMYGRDKLQTGAGRSYPSHQMSSGVSILEYLRAG